MMVLELINCPSHRISVHQGFASRNRIAGHATICSNLSANMALDHKRKPGYL